MTPWGQAGANEERKKRGRTSKEKGTEKGSGGDPNKLNFESSTDLTNCKEAKKTKPRTRKRSRAINIQIFRRKVVWLKHDRKCRPIRCWEGKRKRKKSGPQSAKRQNTGDCKKEIAQTKVKSVYRIKMEIREGERKWGFGSAKTVAEPERWLATKTKNQCEKIPGFTGRVWATEKVKRMQTAQQEKNPGCNVNKLESGRGGTVGMFISRKKKTM